jgi:hypothetical protein
MSSLTDILTEFVRDAFQAEGLPTEHAGVTPSNRPDLGQFQSNDGLGAARPLQRSPREAGSYAKKMAPSLQGARDIGD